MNEMEKFQETALPHELVQFEPSPGSPHHEGIVDTIIMPILRNWWAALAIFAIAVVVGVPLIWFFVQPLYESVGAIRVSPTQQSIVFKNVEAEAVISNYRTFMNTQVDLIGSNQVLERAADDLKKANLGMVGPDPIVFLRDAAANKTLLIEPPENTELIKITMRSKSPQQGEKVVDSLINAYMAVEASQFAEGGTKKVGVLEDKLRELSAMRDKQRGELREMSKEYGTTTLTGRQDIMLEQVKSLQSEKTKVQTKKVDIETQIQMLDKTTEEIIPLEKVIGMRNEFLRADPQLKTLSDTVAQLEQGMIGALQTMTAENPELQRRKELLEAMKKRLNERQVEISKNFDDMLKNESARNRDYKLKEVKAELERTTAYEERLDGMLAKHNSETVELGRKQLAIQEKQEQFALTEEMYDAVRRRIEELHMERDRPAQVSIAYGAASMLAKDRRIKLMAANVFGAGMLGMLFALMLDRVHRRVYNPEEVAKRIGVRLIGTTVNSSKVDRAMLRERIVDDFQVIRANLGLFNDEKIPHKVVITSANAREGKTTFAINLATSMARAGAKVLLIDGDMRKPDIGMLLKFDGKSRGVCKVLMGLCSFQEAVWSVPSTGLDVLAGDSEDSLNCFEVLAQPQAARCFAIICAKYDNVIIDTPPILAVPDALLWAKMADVAVIASLAGQTAEPELQKALERLKQINVRVSGVVVNSVSIKSSYSYGYGYGYGYGKGYAHHKETNGGAKRRSILLSVDEPGKTDTNT